MGRARLLSLAPPVDACACHGTNSPGLLEQLGNDFAMHIRQPEVATLEFERQFGVIKSQQVQNGRLQIMHVYPILDSGVTKFVSGAKVKSQLDSAASQPRGISFDVLVAASAVSSEQSQTNLTVVHRP